MSTLKYYAYEPFGTKQLKNFRYNQAVRIPANADRVELAGQGGWDPQTSIFAPTVLEQIDQAFKNVDLALRDAGVKDGWKSVFRVNSYHVGFEVKEDREEMLGRMVKNFEDWMPGHAPVWTCVGVTALGEEDMKVEVEVVAFDGEA